jgi:cytochrome c oxidase cbb3-type subunit 3
MRLSFKKIVFSIAAVLTPTLIFAAGDTPNYKLADYNITLLFLVGLILVLLFVIGMLGGTLRQLSFVVKNKNRKERGTAPGIAKALLLLLFVCGGLQSFAAQTAEVATPAAQSIQGIPVAEFYFLVGITALEFIVIFALSIYIHILLRIIRNVPEYQEVAKVVVKKVSFWDKLHNARSIEEEKDILTDHDYDGIQELDNALPPWWKYGFYLTIVVSFIYIYRFHVSHEGPNQMEEFAAEMQQGEAEKAAYLALAANNIDESNVEALHDAAEIASGKDIFIKSCAACHVADGGGSVGPNLTDQYWLHGGDIRNVFKSIKYGWQDKGMKSWKDDFSPKQLQQIASFVLSLKGTHPAAPKAPQGDLYTEAAHDARPDSANAAGANTTKVAVK